jgi:prepilin-type N-terminal cleavage/methylation domain-containing protein
MNTKRRHSGFTLLEMLISVTIFALISTALYTTFRVGTRAYASGEREIRRMQHARIIFDTISRDLRSVYFLTETSYNNTIRQEVSRFQREMMKHELDGTIDEFLYADSDDPEDEDVKSPYEGYIEIDLNFTAENHEELDEMSFIRYQYDDGMTQVQPWALGRITYYVEDNILYRCEEDIIEPMKDYEGEVTEEKFPRKEILAKGVTKFDLCYGFFYNDDWMEADDWDSNAKRYRNPSIDFDEIFGEDPEEYENDIEYKDMLKKEQMKPPDGIPAFVRVSIEIQDDKLVDSGKKNTKKKKHKALAFSTIIRIPMAQENYLPSLEEDEEDDY